MTRMLFVVLVGVSIGAFACARSVPMLDAEQHDMLLATERRLQEREKQLDALLVLLRGKVPARPLPAELPERYRTR